VMTAVQAAILLLFNNKDVLTINEIIELTGCSPELVKVSLRPMVAQAEYKVLKKQPANGYDTSHKLKIDMSYTSQNRRVRMPTQAMKVTKADREANSEHVEDSRRFTIEANIVRIMKSRITMTHTDLMTETAAQLLRYFKPEPKDIKKRIEDLILREYLTRGEGDVKSYKYLA
jgi:hypothetical protein